ncbi:MAG: HAD family phosphatase [Corynebacterium sp.]|uniref:HAD family hydrolase n=1 Tax=Corynebacterium sp. TaxID=1720 RepID=UPI0026DB948A|nr:HAD family phosphatase [Corynebacterium sp.]MDO4760433.1 HAD family phosphatase [Corynebacterium sp.]
MKAVLWDMDGTLIDSEPLWEIATYELSESMGRRLTPKLREKTVGGSFHNTATICAAHAGISLTESDYTYFQSIMFARMRELLADAPINPGVDTLLHSLKDAGIPSFIVTNTTRELAHPAMKAIGADLFAGSICGDEVAHGKPDPLIYTTAARILKTQPHNCLVFEDSTPGMTAAVNAGCIVFAAPNATHDRPLGVHNMHTPSFVGTQAKDLRQWFQAVQ